MPYGSEWHFATEETGVARERSASGRGLRRRILEPADQIRPRALGADAREIRSDGSARLAHGVTTVAALVIEDLFARRALGR